MTHWISEIGKAFYKKHKAKILRHKRNKYALKKHIKRGSFKLPPIPNTEGSHAIQDK